MKRLYFWLCLVSLSIVFIACSSEKIQEKAEKVRSKPNEPEELFNLYVACGDFPDHCPCSERIKVLSSWLKVAPSGSIFHFSGGNEFTTGDYLIIEKTNDSKIIKDPSIICKADDKLKEDSSSVDTVYIPDTLRFRENFDPPGRKKVVIIGGYVGSREEWHKIPFEGDRDPIHMVVVCDSSGSTATASCNAGNLAMALNYFIFLGAGLPGDSFQIYQTGKTRESAIELLDYQVWPDGTYASRISNFVLLSNFLDVHPYEIWQKAIKKIMLEKNIREDGSAILETLDVAVPVLQERKGDKHLIIFSDGRQITPGVVNFEMQPLPSSSEFTSWAQTEFENIRLGGIKVKMCGFHNYASSGSLKDQVDSSLARTLPFMWKQVLTALGAVKPIIQEKCYTTDIANQYWKN